MIFAEQLAVVPPFDPAQVQFQGPVPLSELAVPALQRLVAGAEGNVPPLAEPHVPLTGAAVILAEQLAVVPPFAPWQLQVHGPEPATALAVPALQRLLVGAELNVPPLAEPHWPLMTWGPKGLNAAMTVQSEMIGSVV